MQNNNKRIATRLDIVVCVALACVILVVFGTLSDVTDIVPALAVLLGLFSYLLLLFIWAAIRLGTESVTSARRLRESFGSGLELVIANLHQPAFLCDLEGHIVWCNRMLVDMVGRHDLVVGAEIDDVCAISAEDIEKGETIATIGDRLYRYDGIRVDGRDRSLWFVVFTDCTEYMQLSALHEAETTVVAYIVMDNIEELLQYVQSTYRSAATAAEDAIKNWVSEMGGVLKGYEKDKYIAFFNQSGLRRCVERRFDVLDSVRSVRVGDGMPITVSIGVSTLGTTLSEKEESAQAALDMALQRGGDQAVLRTENGDDFFGGKTKAVQKRANVRSRVVASELATLMARTDSVLIMGHRFPDFDSFGAAVGMARFAMMCGVHPHVIVDTENKNLAACFDKLEDLDGYENMFVDGNEGLDLIRPNTLLLVVDVNNMAHVESPEIVRNVRDIAIIDHHRKTTEFEKEPVVAYIEPSASSASELVAEILEQHMSTRSVLKEEAELMLAGILLDTKQFTRNTGTRTFSAALYLRAQGAIPGESNDLFRADVEDLTKEARFHSNVFLYRDRVAISYVDGDADESYRIIAAKAADKLLTVKGVSASVTLVNIDGKVHISARSDGSINVQLVLERIGGGGHYDVAGAQVEGESIQTVILRLRESIDRYLDNN